jgi:hypothetical protein
MLTIGEAIHIDYGHWRNVSRWLAAMKARPGWASANEGFYQYLVKPLADKAFEPL